MRAVFGSALAVVLAVAAGGWAQDKDTPVDAKKLIGRWEPQEPPKGDPVVLEFARDGKMSIATTIDGKPQKFDGTYSLTGNKLSITVKFKEDVKRDLTVLKLTDGELTTEDGKGKKETLRRVKPTP